MQACLVWDQQAGHRLGVVARHTVITVPNVNGPVVVGPGDADSGGRADAKAKKRQHSDKSFHRRVRANGSHSLNLCDQASTRSCAPYSVERKSAAAAAGTTGFLRWQEATRNSSFEAMQFSIGPQSSHNVLAGHVKGRVVSAHTPAHSSAWSIGRQMLAPYSKDA